MRCWRSPFPPSPRAPSSSPARWRRAGPSARARGHSFRFSPVRGPGLRSWDQRRWRSSRMSLTLTLASRNLFHDSLRFVATMVGIVFSVVLVMVQMGLFFGFGRMVTTMIDHASADLWIVAKGAKSFEDLSLLDSNVRDKTLAINGVASVTPVVVGFS